MFEYITGAVAAHKYLVIAAIAISAVAIYMVPSTLLTPASAEHRDINITREIVIPCEPYCVRPPVLVEGIDREAGPVHIQISFRFV